jgi:hypothetical protein
MATSTLVQYLEKTQVTVSGGTTPVGASTSNRSQVEEFLAETTVTAGDWLEFDTAQTGASKVLVVRQATANGTGNPLVCGVALATVTGTATSPAVVRVCVGGYVAKANVANAVAAAGVALSVDAAGAGQAVAITAADTGPACGVSLSAPVANVAEAWIYKRF